MTTVMPSFDHGIAIRYLPHDRVLVTLSEDDLSLWERLLERAAEEASYADDEGAAILSLCDRMGAEHKRLTAVEKMRDTLRIAEAVG